MLKSPSYEGSPSGERNSSGEKSLGLLPGDFHHTIGLKDGVSVSESNRPNQNGDSQISGGLAYPVQSHNLRTNHFEPSDLRSILFDNPKSVEHVPTTSFEDLGQFPSLQLVGSRDGRENAATCYSFPNTDVALNFTGGLTLEHWFQPNFFSQQQTSNSNEVLCWAKVDYATNQPAFDQPAIGNLWTGSPVNSLLQTEFNSFGGGAVPPLNNYTSSAYSSAFTPSQEALSYPLLGYGVSNSM